MPSKGEVKLLQILWVNHDVVEYSTAAALISEKPVSFAGTLLAEH